MFTYVWLGSGNDLSYLGARTNKMLHCLVTSGATILTVTHTVAPIPGTNLVYGDPEDFIVPVVTSVQITYTTDASRPIAEPA